MSDRRYEAQRSARIAQAPGQALLSNDALWPERCPQCGGAMERVVIDGHDSWACPEDAYAYAVDQEEDILL